MDAQTHYRQQAIETASPGQLVSMLYHGAIARVASATVQIGEGGFEQANRELQRAQQIVAELRVTLDFQRGGVMARNLDALYSFCLERLIEANMTKSAAPLDSVRSTLLELASGWDEMLVGQAAAPAGERAMSYRSAAAVG